MKVRLLRAALEDLAAGRRFYERQEAGVGAYFLQSLFEDIDLLAGSAGIHREQFGFHRLLSRKFPFGIYYRLTGGEAVVFRVLDCRRNPLKIRRALRARPR